MQEYINANLRPTPLSDFFCTLHTYISTCKNLHVPLNESFNLDKPMWE